MLYAIVALLVIILDQWTKLWVSGNIALNTGSRELIPGFLKLVNIHNDGAALGFLSGKNAGMLFVILCAVFTIFVIIALATRLIKSSVGRWSLLFIMAGGLSNCIDRLLSGYVQDMFMPTFMDNLPIFNVADIFITLFCLVFILFVLFGGRRDDDYDDEDEDEDEDEEEELEDDEEEEEELEDEEEDELPPARRPSKYDRAARNGKAPSRRGSLLFGSRDDEEEEEDEDEEETEEEEEVDEAPAPRREPKEKSAKKTSRRDRQAELDEKYARFKAERAAREQQWSAPQEEAPAVVDPADPFAEWDAAPKKTEKVEPTPAPEVAPAPAPAPEVPAAPVAPPAPKEEPKDESMEFSLEDILAEFK